MSFKDKEKNAAYQRKWRAANREKSLKYNLEYNREYRIKNRDKIRARDKVYWQTPGRKASIRKYRESPIAKETRRRYWNSDRGKIVNKRFNNSLKGLMRYKKYHYTVKGTLNFLKKKDKAKFGIISSDLNVELIQSIIKRDDVCVYCLKEFDGDSEYDHVNPFRPISKFNIVRCCSKCNQSKSNANVLEWLAFKGYPVTEKIIGLYKMSYQ